MSKYKPLEIFLYQSGQNETEVTFAELENIVDFSLPRSAYTDASWWSNEMGNGAITVAWLSAGYVSQNVNLPQCTLIFRKASSPSPKPSTDSAKNRCNANQSNQPRESNYFATLRGSCKDVVTIPQGVDLTQPVGTGWKVVEED